MTDKVTCVNGGPHKMKTDYVVQNEKEGTTTVYRVCTVPSCEYTDKVGPIRA
jgi:hypothetical protein